LSKNDAVHKFTASYVLRSIAQGLGYSTELAKRAGSPSTDKLKA
jgi:hypothetical protein